MRPTVKTRLFWLVAVLAVVTVLVMLLAVPAEVDAGWPACKDTLTVVSNPPEAGTVEIYPKKEAYAPGESVMLTAVPAAGYVFSNWSGQTEGISDLSQNPVTFAMGDRTDNNRVITANFARSDLLFSVTALPEPNSGVSIQLQPPQPSGGYPVNQVIYVQAIAQTGYAFSRWTGDLVGSESFTSLVVSEDKSFTAIFNPTMNVHCRPVEGGSVLLEPVPLSGYPVGTEVTLTAKANKGYRFVSWEGDASGSDCSVTLTVYAPNTVTAQFVAEAASRWWLWLIIGLVGLFGALILLRLVYVRRIRGVSDELQWPDE